jgi:hypothetical protein
MQAAEVDSEVLPGEDCDDVLPDDVDHWVRVYEELVRAVDRMLLERAVGADPITRNWLLWRRNRFRRRLAWWRGHTEA